MLTPEQTDDILALAQSSDERPSAWVIKERLGLTQSVRQVQRVISHHLGPRPVREKVKRRDPLRVRVVALMVASGLDEHYCSDCLTRGYYPCFIRELARDLSVGSLAFVCAKCRRPGDC